MERYEESDMFVDAKKIKSYSIIVDDETYEGDCEKNGGNGLVLMHLGEEKITLHPATHLNLQSLYLFHVKRNGSRQILLLPMSSSNWRMVAKIEDDDKEKKDDK